MDIQKLISDLKEKNKEKATRVTLSEEVDGYTFTPYELDQITTDTAHQVALAVIEEMRKVQYGTNGEGRKWVMMNDLEDHLTTLEAKIKDI